MRKILIAAAAATVLLLSPGLVPPAHADHPQWFVGTTFSIGRVHFNVVARNPSYGPAGYYFRVAQPFRYPGQRCTSHCFKGARHSYHDPHCPARLHHFGRHRQNPHAAFDRYAPPHREFYLQYRQRGHDDDDYDDRDDDYDDDDRRYRSRNRYDDRRGHRHRRPHDRSYPHPPSCPYRH